MKTIVGYLLSMHDVRKSLDMSESLESFKTHWDNYELTYRTKIKVTEKLYKTLLKGYGKEELDEKYFAHWWEKIKRIVETKTCERINGQLCDIVTANAMFQVGTRLSDANRTKFLSMSFPVAHHITWKLLSKVG